MDARRTELFNINIQACSKAEIAYRAHAQKCKHLLHCTESLDRDDVRIIG